MNSNFNKFILISQCWYTHEYPNRINCKNKDIATKYRRRTFRWPRFNFCQYSQIILVDLMSDMQIIEKQKMAIAAKKETTKYQAMIQ